VTAVERPDRASAASKCDGWPERTVFDVGLPLDADGRWPVCPEPVRSIVYDHEHDTFSGLCAEHLAAMRAGLR
jgi:hypothetical protein